jgi:hypothetical protein
MLAAQLDFGGKQRADRRPAVFDVLFDDLQQLQIERLSGGGIDPRRRPLRRHPL